MQLQELNEEFLLNLEERLIFEIELRYMVHSDQAEGDPWIQPMYLVPMWNIVEKIKSFKIYFDRLGVNFPFQEVYRHPIDLATIFPTDMIHYKTEELMFNGEKVTVEYRFVE